MQGRVVGPNITEIYGAIEKPLLLVGLLRGRRV